MDKAGFNVRGIPLQLASGQTVILNAGNNMTIFPQGNLITFNADVPPVSNSVSVTTLNSLSGAINLTSTGGTVAITTVGNNINLESSGGGSVYYTWSEITTTSTPIVNGNAYILNNSSRVTATLPATAAIGDHYRVVGKGAGGWKIAQNSGQTIHYGTQSATSGVTGSIASQNAFDALELVCTTANTDFTVLATQGNLTVT